MFYLKRISENIRIALNCEENRYKANKFKNMTFDFSVVCLLIEINLGHRNANQYKSLAINIIFVNLTMLKSY